MGHVELYIATFFIQKAYIITSNECFKFEQRRGNNPSNPFKHTHLFLRWFTTKMSCDAKKTIPDSTEIRSFIVCVKG